MRSDRLLRAAAAAFGVLFVLVVAVGWVPGLIQHQHHERLLLGLFKLSMLDDITHGVTAVALLAAALHSGRAARFAFVTFGSYYALDAIFFLVNGVVTAQPPMDNLMLNAPHVAISAIMLTLAYGRLAQDVPATARGTTAAGTSRAGATAAATR